MRTWVAGAVLPAIVKVLRTLKATEDATSEPATQNIYLLCDTALAVAKAIVDVHSPGTASTGKYPGSGQGGACTQPKSAQEESCRVGRKSHLYICHDPQTGHLVMNPNTSAAC